MFVLFASGETDTNNIVFLKGYGWEVRTKSVEKEDIIIPKPFDRVYENYNDIQLKPFIHRMEGFNMKIIMRRDFVIFSKSRNWLRQRRNLSDERFESENSITAAAAPWRRGADP